MKKWSLKKIKTWNTTREGAEPSVLRVKNQVSALASKTKVGMIVGFSLSALGLFVMAAVGVSYVNSSRLASEKIESATELVALSGSVAKNALGSVRGEANGLDGLEADNTAFTKQMNKFIGVGANWALQSSDEKVQDRYKELADEWSVVNAHVMSILEKRADLKALKSRVEKAEEDLSTIEKKVARFAQEGEGSFNAQEESLARVWTESVKQIYVNTVSLQGRDDVSPELAFRIAKNLAYFKQVLARFEKGNAEEGIRAVQKAEQKVLLAEIKDYLKSGVEENLNVLSKSMDDIQDAKIESSKVNAQYPVLLKKVNLFLSELKAESGAVNQQAGLYFIAGLLVVVFGAVFVLLVNASKEKQVGEERRKENEENMRAIHQLLSEIEGLGEGNLTRHATVDNGITHEIALAMNDTVSQLKRLVANVRTTTLGVSDLATETGRMSQELVKKAAKQESDVQNVSETMTRISQELDEVAQKTAQSSDLAATALDLSRRGEAVVYNTIEGMNNIRESIQETSKRIKSLGESSQEIGQVTQLIRQVGSRIQVLALNAAIQSADAGEAGKGFAVVAEEVQALADEAAASAQKIDRLVQNIQGSAKEAISTMELATSRVVDGANTADNAGEALRQIGQAASSLREIVDVVTQKMQEESENTTDLVFKMTQVKAFSTDARNNMDRLQGQMNEMEGQTKELKGSVDGFRLDA
jgi:twitching motility protein PilJ